GEPAEEMRILLDQIMAVLTQPVTLLRHVKDVTVVTLPVEEILAPGDAITHFELAAPHVLVDAFPELLDDPHDLMAEDARAWIGPASLIRMDIGAADR